MTFKDLTGKRFGQLTVLAYRGVHITPCGTARRLWECECDCGTIKTIQEINLKKRINKKLWLLEVFENKRAQHKTRWNA